MEPSSRLAVQCGMLAKHPIMGGLNIMWTCHKLSVLDCYLIVTVSNFIETGGQ